MNGRSAEDIRNDIKSAVSRVSRIDVSEMGDQVLIRDELGIDSLMGMEILSSCEKVLGIEIDDTAFTEVERMGAFLDLMVDFYRQDEARRPAG